MDHCKKWRPICWYLYYFYFLILFLASAPQISEHVRMSHFVRPSSLKDKKYSVYRHLSQIILTTWKPETSADKLEKGSKLTFDSSESHYMMNNAELLTRRCCFAVWLHVSSVYLRGVYSPTLSKLGLQLLFLHTVHFWAGLESTRLI